MDVPQIRNTSAKGSKKLRFSSLAGLFTYIEFVRDKKLKTPVGVIKLSQGHTYESDGLFNLFALILIFILQWLWFLSAPLQAADLSLEQRSSGYHPQTSL